VKRSQIRSTQNRKKRTITRYDWVNKRNERDFRDLGQQKAKTTQQKEA